MKRSFEYRVLKNTYKSMEDIIELENTLEEMKRKGTQGLSLNEKLMAVHKRMLYADFRNDFLLNLNYTARMDFIVKTKRVDAEKISSLFEMDIHSAEKIFHYLQLTGVGKCVDDYIEIENEDEFKRIFTKQLFKQI